MLAILFGFWRRALGIDVFEGEIMTEQTLYWLIAAGVVVCIGLAWFIQQQLGTIRAQRQVRDQQQAEYQRKVQQHRDHLISSIQIICRALPADENLKLPEACIRLYHLMDQLAPNLKTEPDFAVIGEVYEQVRHIPMLEAWQTQSKADKRRYLKEMNRIDQQYQDAVEAAALKLAEYPFERLFH